MPHTLARPAEALRAHVADLLGEDDPEFLAEITATFRDSATALSAQARTAQAASDAEALRAAAHQMRGSSASVGLSGLADAWTRVEHDGAEPDEALALTDAVLEALG